MFLNRNAVQQAALQRGPVDSEEPHTPTFPSQFSDPSTNTNFTLSQMDYLATPQKGRPSMHLQRTPHSAERLLTPSRTSGGFRTGSEVLSVDRSPPVASRMTLEHSDTQTIGRGSFGQVVRGVFDLDGMTYAIKQSAKLITGEGDMQHRLQEAYAASACSNPHLIRYYDSWIEEGRLNLRMEYIDGNNILSWPRPWAQQDICLLLEQIGIGLHWLHTAHIAHLDVKPENILATSYAVDNEGNRSHLFKLGDFGLARRTDTSLHYRGENDDEGDHRYLCPYLLAHYNGVSTYAKEADIYSLGASVVELMGGVPSQVRYRDFGEMFFNRELYPSDMLRDLIQRMCNVDPRGRPTAFEVLDTVLRIQVVDVGDQELAQELEPRLHTRRLLLESLQEQVRVLTAAVEEAELSR